MSVKQYLHTIKGVTATMANKHVTFADSISTTKIYEIERSKEYGIKRGEGWQQTTDLIYREFRIPVMRGGCGGDWKVLERKLDEIEEPYWELIGGLWATLHPGKKRLEEYAGEDSESELDSDSESDSDIDSDSDSDSNNKSEIINKK